jgi:sterol desaturase/sphingolipid hydroxylase (fatty acid hydroxylase superfamily)
MIMSILSLIMSSSVVRGFLVAGLAVILTAALEMASLPHVQKLLATKDGPELYRSAILTNIFNNLVIGPLVYHFTITYICQEASLTTLERIRCVIGIVVVEGILYYSLHKAFHEIKGLYWIHRYHHKFNTAVVPSSANAVSVAEYVSAYMIPIVSGVVLMQADEVSAVLAAAIIAVTNLLIHTPSLSNRKYFWMLVSTQDHLEHHRKNKSNYGAPVIHMDRILASFSESFQQFEVD